MENFYGSPMPYPLTIREEELKNKVAADFFAAYDSTRIIGNIDFCIAPAGNDRASYLWAEAKKGNRHDIYESFVQLILTIGKARAFEQHLPPALLGAFDAEKIAFLPYHAVMEVFSQNDFNWNVTPSDHETKEFQQLFNLVRDNVEKGLLLFRFGQDDDRLREYIRENFREGAAADSRIEITKNNFISIYYHWRARVMPTISVQWENAKRQGILDADFYLADMLSQDNATLKDKLYVLLKSDHYEFARSIDELMGAISIKTAAFNDGQKAHCQFWNHYRRPPREEFWDYIVDRRDLLVPGDIRERRGSFYTPRQWVELSQQYIADVLGEDWQDEYTVWDCAAGTGNLLAGLTDKYRIWASTLDQADVDVMKDRIANGANLLESHVFQFDFLNDDFSKCPQGLRDILDDPEKRKKLLIYINPPYAEATNARTVAGTGENKTGVASTKTYARYQAKIGTAARELFAQFLIRIFTELRNCRLANFSKLKNLQAGNFAKFRNAFAAKLERLFLVPSMTFNNVNGQFPIGFFVWNTAQTDRKKDSYWPADVYDVKGNFIGTKKIYQYNDENSLVVWQRKFYDRIDNEIALIKLEVPDIQHNKNIFISILLSNGVIKKKTFTKITKNNLLEFSIYCTIRHVIEATWLNDRDQFLHPKKSWETDTQFQTDCLAWTLFADSNNISAAHGVNHWIPFTEAEVEAGDAFASHFMTDYMSGRLGQKSVRSPSGSLLPARSSLPDRPLEFSPAAQAVFAAGREVWHYYHAQPGANPNAALYDIKAHFQGRNDRGRMNATSDDAGYNKRMAALREALAVLAAQIAPKVYEHGFLKK